MQVLSATASILVGQTSLAFPFPGPLVDTTTQAAFLVVMNLGAADAYVNVGPNLGITADASGQIVAAPLSAVTPGTLRTWAAIAAGPIVQIPISQGDTAFAAVAVPVQIIAANTNGTADSDSTTLVVDSSIGIEINQTVTDNAGLIPAGTVVTEIAGTSITISQATTGALTEAALQFSAPPATQPPAVLIVALGA
jgi:hypothetical protein